MATIHDAPATADRERAGRVYRLPGSDRPVKFEHKRKRAFERALAEAARDWVRDGLGALERPHDLLTKQPLWAASLLIAYGVTDGPIPVDEADRLIDQAAEVGTNMELLMLELMAEYSGHKPGPLAPAPAEAAAPGAGDDVSSP